MPSMVGKYQNQQREEMMGKFKDYQQLNTVSTENKCRYNMLFCILREFIKSEQQTVNSIDSIYQKVDQIVTELKVNKPNFLDNTSYTVLLTDLRNRCFKIPTSVSDTIKLSFVRKLPSMLAPSLMTNDIQKNLEENNIASEQEDPQDINLNNDTQMIMNGYYEAVVGVLKECSSNSWISTL